MSQSFPVQTGIPSLATGGKRDLGSAFFQLSAGVAARQLLLQPAGKAAWHAPELLSAGDGDGGLQLPYVSLNLISYR